jgi:hypothetical protein
MHTKKTECADLTYQNLGTTGNFAPGLATLSGIPYVLFAWVCNGGPDNGGVPKIDPLHTAQGKQLAQLNSSIAYQQTTEVDQGQDGIVIVGYYNPASGDFNWISILNAPNTQGNGRGCIRTDRNLNEQRSGGELSYDFPNPAGQGTLVTVWFYAEGNSTPTQLKVNFGKPI